MSTETLVAAVLAGIAVVAVLLMLSRRKEPKPWIQSTACPNCGWKGQTSRYAGRCPKCNTPIGDQRARRAR